MEIRRFLEPSDNIKYVQTEESVTVPDDSLSIKDILFRFSRGLPLDIYERQPLYDDSESDYNDDDFSVHPMNESLDLVEIEEIARNSEEILNNFNNHVNKENPTSNIDSSNKEIHGESTETVKQA